MRKRGMVSSMLVLSALGFSLLVGCESGETVRQDREVRTRDDGTKVIREDKVVRQSDGTTVKTETRKVDRPDDDD